MTTSKTTERQRKRNKAAASKIKTARPKKKAAKKKSTLSYDQFKAFEGRQYTGMQIGRRHHWYYKKGDRKEPKITPDLREISFDVTKRRKGRGAPKGSGVPVDTEYHWYILANQTAKKLNANDYSTSMRGLKFKLAHKRADKNKWSLSGATQRQHLIKFLKDIIHQLEKEPIPLKFRYKGQQFNGEGVPETGTCHAGVCYEADVMLNDESMGIIRCSKSGWKMEGVEQGLVDVIGTQVY